MENIINLIKYMSKIIINNNTEFPDLNTLDLVARVIADCEITRNGTRRLTVTISPENFEMHINLTKNNTLTFTINQL